MKRLVGSSLVLFGLGCGGMGMPDADTLTSKCTAYVDSGEMPVWSPVQVLEGNVEAMNEEVIDCYMGVLHPDSPQISATYLSVVGLFETYDLQVELEEPFELIASDDETADVRFVQITRNTNGAEFRDNRLRGTHHLKKDADGRWRLLSTEQGAVEFLDAVP